MNGRLINATRFAMRWSRIALQVFYEENYFDFTSKTSCRAPLKDKHARIVDLSKNEAYPQPTFKISWLTCMARISQPPGRERLRPQRSPLLGHGALPVRTTQTSNYMENGRWYHGFRRGLYMYPCDEPENDRMDIYHQFFAVARRGQLHQAPHANVKLPEAVRKAASWQEAKGREGARAEQESHAEPLCDVSEQTSCPPQSRINMYKDEEGNFNGKVVRRAASRVGPREARQHENTPSRSSIPEENSSWRVVTPETTTMLERGMIPSPWSCKERDGSYHNFAKNTACLRCGANRASAAVVADFEDQSPSGKKKRKARKKPLAGRPWKKEGSDEDGVDMDDIKKQVELIAREFGNVRNVHVDTVHDEMRLIFRIEFDSIDAAQRAIQSLRRTPVVLADWTSSPPSHKRSASARMSCARRGRSACSSTHLRRIPSGRIFQM
ncbi:hypothetical protein J4E89_000225 [Alternaria sp. Ai002NY15]|nr:hypothetical protein J4E89_000225 [Alternaria sp. Ai002NY15]